MPDFISIQTVGEEELLRSLDGFRGDLERFAEPVAGQLEEAIFVMVGAQYASDGRRGPTGRPWSRKQSTIDAYTAQNRKGFKYINENMRRTNALFISETRRGAPHAVRDAGPNYLTMGTDLPYGKIQQERGQEQYDPTEADARNFIRIIVRGQKDKALNHTFDYKEGTGEIPF